jgi:hypothetical protein
LYHKLSVVINGCERMIKNPAVILKSREFISAWITIAIIGVVRYAIGVYVNIIRGSLGLGWIGICFSILVIFIVALIVISLISIRLIRHTRSILPAGVFWAGIIVVVLLPLPFPPRPPTPEEKLFLAHRSDFEQVVEFARDNKLAVAIPDCPAGYFPPAEYQFVSAAQCMFVDYGDNGLTVQFAPFDAYHRIVYVARVTEKPCDEAYGSTEKKLDDHWYVCQEDWN